MRDDVIGFITILVIIIFIFILEWLVFNGLMPMGWCGRSLIFNPSDVGRCIVFGRGSE